MIIFVVAVDNVKLILRSVVNSDDRVIEADFTAEQTSSASSQDVR